MTSKRQQSRCQARTKKGKPCRAAATEGGLCFFHANPNKAAELGRIGGKANRHVSDATRDPLPDLKSIAALREMVSRLITEVYAGQLHPRIAAGLAPLINLQLRVVESALEDQLAGVEKRLDELTKSLPEQSQTISRTGR